jgi:methionyl-tRNA formyltransferase
MGSGDFAAAILEKLAGSEFRPAIVFTQPDKPAGRRQELSPSPAKIVTQKYGLEIYEPKSLKTPETEETVKSFKPDLIIVTDYGKIIPKNILGIPRFGAINVHPSLLPRHRGATPIQYTILEGDKETGVTIILIDEQIDHGPIITNKKLKIENKKLTFNELFTDLTNLGGNLLLNTLPKWLSGEIKPIPQDETQATYTKILAREDGKIDWQKSAEEIDRKVRAFEKWPGTWCEWSENGNKMRLKILKTKVLYLGRAKSETPGLVFLTEQKESAVNCNPGSLILEELQLEGKNKTSGKEFFRGHPKFIGSTLK